MNPFIFAAICTALLGGIMLFGWGFRALLDWLDGFRYGSQLQTAAVLLIVFLVFAAIGGIFALQG